MKDIRFSETMGTAVAVFIICMIFVCVVALAFKVCGQFVSEPIYIVGPIGIVSIWYAVGK